MPEAEKSRDDLILENKELREKLEMFQSACAQRVDAYEKLEKSFRHNESLFQSILKTAPFNITISGLDGKVIFTSQHAMAMYGLDDIELFRDRSVLDFISPVEHHRARKVMAEMLNGIFPDSEEFKGRKVDGTEIDLEISGNIIRDDKGTPLYMILYARDITKRKSTEDKLRSLSLAVEQSPVSIVVTNLDGNIEYANPKACETTGYSFEELIGKNPRVLKSGETNSEEYKVLWDTLTSHHQWRGFFHNKKKNGELYWESSVIAPIIDQKGQVTNYLAVKEDITERRKAEKEILRQNAQLAELNATKDKFFRIISHDLRSPFNSIIGFSRLLIDNIDDYPPDEVKKLAEYIHSAGDSTYRLLENLLEWSRAQTGAIVINPEPIKIKELFATACSVGETMAVAKEITIECEVSENLSIYADRNIVNTVLRNLISNAIKFTHRSGKIYLKAEIRSNETEISVRDTGIGMSEETSKKLFQVNEKVNIKGTENEKGSGIGLLLCKELITMHGGSIKVESRPGEGSTFSFSIPLVYLK